MMNYKIRFNELHNSNAYIDIFQYDFNIKEININKPLQTLINRNDKNGETFLKNAGFKKVRTTYTLIATINDLEMKESKCIISKTHNDEIRNKKMYTRYIELHEKVNPYSGSEESFYKLIPKDIYYFKHDFAFVEDNEIAYVYGENALSFQKFAISLVLELFKTHDEITFEVDDNDEIGLILLDLFNQNKLVVYDTYVK